MAPIIYPAECTNCGICVEVCPCDVLHHDEDALTPLVKYPYECWHCAACVMECPVTGAIELRIPLPQMILYK